MTAPGPTTTDGAAATAGTQGPRRPARRRAPVVVAGVLVLALVVGLVVWLLTRPETVRPEDFGAVGDGVADDTAALQTTLDALEPGQRLELAEGSTYTHADVLVLTVPDVHVTGGGELRATDEERSSFRVEADDVEISDLLLTVPETTRRWDATEQQRLLLRGTTGVEVHDVTVRGSAAAGIFLDGASSDFLLEDVVVEGTRADGIHVSGGSHDGRVVDATTRDTGDDGIAVVSYAQDGAPSARVEVESPVVRGSAARGLSVVGGEDVTWTDVDVEGTGAAGVYVAAEGEPYFTTSVARVVLDGGRVADANTDEGIDHGAVLVYDGSSESSVSDVTVEDLEVVGTRASASRQVGVIADGGGETITGVTLTGLAVEGGPDGLLSAPAATDVDVSGWTRDGEDVDPLAGG